MGEITGRKVLIFTVTAFGIIIAVNVVMAWKAISTFPGLEVKNSYVASQTFDAERAAQASLGWTLAHDYDAAAGELRLTFSDRQGAPVEVQDLSVLVGRTTMADEDRRPEFVRHLGAYSAPVALAPGKWMLHVKARAADGTAFQQRIDLFVKG
ncbi:nitrogen fixation protein FixH [Aliigemmobacter aestuarii]|uniref:Nitrogen fixation protein FixH n=1 Tax=Aliigemmobacter aestuarii TaxID=1445661 RepID=A0A4S3MP25_9RHOB|nr:FixH family protein [Gemmobacter aestuarii]THD83475.1 nitrogen fixation protein FixH [Gemmobacter aestuarii]